MSEIHEFKCDNCLQKAPAKYNGEHWLPPQGWIQLYDPHAAVTLNRHTCDKCFKKPEAKKEKRKTSPAD